MNRQRPLFIACIYLAGFLQGSAFVLIPALGNTLSAAPYQFSSSAYAVLFLPQTASAIVGAAAAGWVQHRLGMGRLFRLGLLANHLAMLLLLGVAQAGGHLAYALMLIESLLLGLGFGWTLAAINHYSAHFFSKSASAAITLLNAVIGGATAASPIIMAVLQTQWNWGLWPFLLAIGFIAACLPLMPEADDASSSVFWPRGLLPFVSLVLIYAICEGSFGSWASIYLNVDKHLGNHAGTLGLSAFWGSMTLFRVVLAPLPERWISRRALLRLSAAGIAACFAVLPMLSGACVLLGTFALAGAACSIYYPFVMSLSLARFPRQQTQVAGLVVAALMVGEGLGSYAAIVIDSRAYVHERTQFQQSKGMEMKKFKLWQWSFASALAFAAPLGIAAQNEVTADQVVTAIENTFGVTPGERRNHTKGTCALGEFVGSPEAATYSRSALFSGKPIPVVARFSLAGGNPKAPDTAKSARGMALEFKLPDGGLQHMTMLNTPVFGAMMPRTFLDQMIAMKPDPVTGKPDPEKIKTFKATHPDNLAQAEFLEKNNPPASYATSAYFGIHTFKFINTANKTTLVRWRFMPQDGEKRLTDDQLKTTPPNFLEQALIERTRQGPARWDMMISIGKPGDPENNPTLAWPESRKQIRGGTLTISAAMPQKGAACEKINFDPLVMGDGIAPTNDPILLFRSPAYAISFGKRLGGM